MADSGEIQTRLAAEDDELDEAKAIEYHYFDQLCRLLNDAKGVAC